MLFALETPLVRPSIETNLMQGGQMYALDYRVPGNIGDYFHSFGLSRFGRSSAAVQLDEAAPYAALIGMCNPMTVEAYGSGKVE